MTIRAPSSPSRLRDRQADAGAAAGDDRDLVLERSSVEHGESDYRQRSMSAVRRKPVDARCHTVYDPTRRHADPALANCRAPDAEAFARLFEAVHEGVYIGAVDGARQRDAVGQSLPQADVRLRRRDAARRRCARSSRSASSIRRRATASSSGCSATARSPTTCCGCAAPIGRRSGSRSPRTPNARPDGRCASKR